MADNCLGGQISTLQVQNLDCTCISISSITWNAAGTQFTITLSNGQSITSPVLTGATGPAPTISFRVSGTTLQYSVNGGTSWTSLIDLTTLVDGKNIITNELEDAGTSSSSWETLGTTQTDYTNSSKNLSADGDMLKITGRFISSVADGNTRLRLNGSSLLGGVNYGFVNGIAAIEYEITIGRIDATNISCITKVYRYMPYGSSYLISSNGIFIAPKQDIVVPTLASNNLTITAESDAVTSTANEIVLEYFRNEIYKTI